MFMDVLLELMVSTVVRLEWQDKTAHHHRCFHFLLEQFKIHYLPRICPDFDYTTSLYRPNLELPVLRKAEIESEMVFCRVSLIKWVAGHMHQMKRSGGSSDAGGSTSGGGNIGGGGAAGGPLSLLSTNSTHSHISDRHDDDHESSAPTSLDSALSSMHKSANAASGASAHDETIAGGQIVRDVLCSSRDNVNFIHEVYRQAFLLTFQPAHTLAIRKVVAVYKDLIQSGGNAAASGIEVPPYVLEPLELEGSAGHDSHMLSAGNEAAQRSSRLRNDSYLGAIQKENLLVRAGLQNTLQIFTTHAANVFLLEMSPPGGAAMLEEQTDASKRVLNIYRYMVMNNRMDNCTWEQLLLVLLQITQLVLGASPPNKKALGAKLAQPIFQTLIVTWIKANLNVVISRELWDRFLHVLTSLTNWEDLIKEWAKTMETLTRVLARHVYNLDLTNLPLEQKTKKVRRSINRVDNTVTDGVGASARQRANISNQDTTSLTGTEDGRTSSGKHGRGALISRSFSETNLAKRRFARVSVRSMHRQRRFHSLDNLRTSDSPDSTTHSRSPSPSASTIGGGESSSIKDSPLQLDVLSDNTSTSGGAAITSSPATVSALSSHARQHSLQPSQLHVTSLQERGIVCGGAVRGWLPDVAVVLWRRMLGALGDVNGIKDPRLHAQVFDYLVKLTDTLIKIKLNQGISADNMNTPAAPELVPPITYILPWCFGALNLSSAYEAGKLSALRLLCTVTISCDSQHRGYLPHFYRSLHIALSGTSRPTLNTALRYLGPRFLSLQLPGASLLLLDQIHACNAVLNSADMSPATPRTEAVSILANLLAYAKDLRQISVLQPDDGFQVMPCPDVKEHVVSILLRAGRHEPTGMARCVAITALGLFVYRELMNQTYHSKVLDAMNIILLALKFNNKVIAQLASNTLHLLCEHAPVLWAQYPRLADAVIRALCSALFLHYPVGAIAGNSDRALQTALLLCLGEWCMRLGPAHLLTISEYGEPRGSCLLLLVFNVLFKLIKGRAAFEDNLSAGGLTQPSVQDDFDPNILLDNIDRSTNSHHSPSRNPQCQQAITLCAKTVLTHLVTHLGHFPMAIGAARLSSLVVEHDDVPDLNSDELSADIFSAPNIQLFVLTRSVIASLIELPTLDLPGGGATAGLSTADRQVRVLLRDLSGKASWDASILYRSPQPNTYQQLHGTPQKQSGSASGNVDSGVEDNSSSTTTSGGSGGDGLDVTVGGRWGPMSLFQPESLMTGVGGAGSALHPTHLQQRAMRHRPPTVLPQIGNAAPDLDQLDDLLQYLGHTSPECLDHCERRLNEPTQPLAGCAAATLEAEAIASVISERHLEVEQIVPQLHQQQQPQQYQMQQRADAMVSQPASRPHSRSTYGYGGGGNRMDSSASSQFSGSIQVEQLSFQQCRLLFSQLGLAGWDRRKQLYLLNKSERLLRELRNMDSQRCRETHKVAVIYVAAGQEDKNSILSNQGGSAAYERFLASLAWEVELDSHTGFLGGLQRQGSTGLTAPYYATSFLEAIFHVATRMPGDTPEAVLNKTRHLGNDEVHVVWSEHSRDYRRDIIPTEFCDILITIYPLGNHLNRVTVNCKPDVPYFGVLFDEAIVESNILAGLVRAAVICASRAKRTTLTFYQQYYEERARSLDTVISAHRDSTTFETFIARVYSPVATASPFYSGSTTTTSTGTSNYSAAAANTGAGDGVNHAATSKLTAALLDSHAHHTRLRSAVANAAGGGGLMGQAGMHHRRSEY